MASTSITEGQEREKAAPGDEAQGGQAQQEEHEVHC